MKCKKCGGAKKEGMECHNCQASLSALKDRLSKLERTKVIFRQEGKLLVVSHKICGCASCMELEIGGVVPLHKVLNHIFENDRDDDAEVYGRGLQTNKKYRMTIELLSEESP